MCCLTWKSNGIIYATCFHSAWLHWVLAGSGREGQEARREKKSRKGEFRTPLQASEQVWTVPRLLVEPTLLSRHPRESEIAITVLTCRDAATGLQLLNYSGWPWSCLVLVCRCEAGHQWLWIPLCGQTLNGERGQDMPQVERWGADVHGAER